MITTTLELALATLVAEFALLAIVFATLLWRGGKRREAAAAASVDALVTNVTESAAPRREALLTVLRATYRFDQEEAERVVTDFIEREQAFYNMLIGVHLGRGGKTLADVPAELTRLVAPWLRLTPRATPDDEAVAALESRNSALSAELDETKQVLDDLMNEYSAAFLRAGASAPAVNLDLDEPAPFDTTEPDTEDLLAQTATGLRDVPGDQLLSMDEFDAAQAETPAASLTGAGDVDDYAADLGFAQQVIDLDADEPADAEEPLPMSSEDDLDALMQNLGLDADGPSSRAQAA